MVLLMHGGDLELSQWLLLGAVGLAASIAVVVALCLVLRVFIDHRERKR